MLGTRNSRERRSFVYVYISIWEELLKAKTTLRLDLASVTQGVGYAIYSVLERDWPISACGRCIRSEIYIKRAKAG